MLIVLGQLHPNHMIFSKDHTRDMAKKKPSFEETQMVPNIGGFFDNLKLPLRKKKGRALGLVPKKVVHAARLQHMEKRLASVQERFDKAKEEEVYSSADELSSSDSYGDEGDEPAANGD